MVKIGITGRNFFKIDKLTPICKHSDIELIKLHSSTLIENCDAIIITSDTDSYFEVATKSLKNAKHLLIDSTLIHSQNEAYQLLKLSNEANVKIKLYDSNLANTTYLATKKHIDKPFLIETRTDCNYKSEYSDHPNILDLLLQDITFILDINKANIKKIHSNGASLISNSIDIANSRIEFDNGCVANITVNRVSNKESKKIKLFQKKSVISIDIKRSKSVLSNIKKEDTSINDFETIVPTINNKDFPFLFIKELAYISKDLPTNNNTTIGIEDRCNSLDIANTIIDKIRYSSEDI